MTPPVERLKQIGAHPVARQFLRFAAIGAVATAVHYAILIALVEGAGMDLLPSTSIGFIAGAVVSYTLNRRYTFETSQSFGRGLAMFIAVGFVGLGLNGLIVSLLARAGLLYILAQMIATGLVLIWNFAAARLVVFRA